jgi:hypothetical protein
LFVGFVAIADPLPTKQNHNSLAPENSKAANIDLSIAKVELAASYRFQDQILSTVYWSLGTIAGLAILLVGYGWWTNSSVYDRDKQSLERELRVLLTQEINKMNEQFRIEFAKQNLDASESLTSNLQMVEDRITTSLKDLIEYHKKEVSVKLSQQKTQLQSMHLRILEIELENKIKERNKYIDKKSYRNALQDSVTALSLAIELSYEYQVGEVLDLITEDMNNIINSERDPIDNFLIGQLVDVLEKVKGSHAHAAAGLKSKVPELMSTKKV